MRSGRTLIKSVATERGRHSTQAQFMRRLHWLVVSAALFSIAVSAWHWSARSAQAASAALDDPGFMQIAKLMASDRNTNDFFGLAVATNGTLVAVGAASADLGQSTDAGAVYVFARSGASYIFQQKITAPIWQIGFNFGSAVALSGDTLAVGASGSNGGRGAVYIYGLAGSNFALQQMLDEPNLEANSSFGQAVALAGETLVVGASGDDVGGKDAQGSVFVYKRAGGPWTQQQQLTANDGMAADRFGSAVAFTPGTLLGGATILIGAHQDQVDSKANQGSAYIFTYSGATWGQQQRLIANNGAAQDHFGAAVAINGDTALIGAYGNDLGLLGDTGSAYVFTRTGASWSQQQQLSAADAAANDRFGVAVALGDDTLIVGAQEANIAPHADQGAAYVFTRANGTWSQGQKLLANDGAATDFFGAAVALHGSTIVAGASGDDYGAGAAYVFATNTPPTITASAPARSAGSKPVPIPIATVSDAEEAADDLQVTINDGASAVVNGVTVTNLTVAPNGIVRAMVATTCNATAAGFTLRVTDIRGATAEAALTVLVAPNTPPALSFNALALASLGAGTYVSPLTSLSDNGANPLVAVQSVTPGFTGAVVVNQGGGVTITNAGPVGDYTVTIRATDNCGLTTDAAFTLTVTNSGGCALLVSPATMSFAAASGNATLTVSATSGNCAWTAVSNAPWLTINPPASGSGSGALSFSVAPNPAAARRQANIIIGNQIVTVYQGRDFLDVPPAHPFYNFIGKLSARGITNGCGNGNYCPDASVTREQMAAFIIRALHTPGYTPPVPILQRFLDVPLTHLFAAHIEQLAQRQITLGCGGNSYCPTGNVTREQMAAFLIRALHPAGYVPPAPTAQRFLDVPPSNLFYAHVEELAVRQITLGCGGGNYCPSDNVTRAQMAAFLVRAFGL